MSMIFLLTLHHLADVAFQPSWLIENKKKHLFAHYEHAFLWAGTVSGGLWILGNFELWHFFFLFFVHACIDISFYVILPRYFEKKYNWVWIDQSLHYLQIAICLI